jgi:hypothetical protein
MAGNSLKLCKQVPRTLSSRAPEGLFINALFKGMNHREVLNIVDEVMAVHIDVITIMSLRLF